MAGLFIFKMVKTSCPRCRGPLENLIKYRLVIVSIHACFLDQTENRAICLCLRDIHSIISF